MIRLILAFFIFLIPSNVFAGGAAVGRVNQNKQSVQQQQEIAIQQAIIQRQAHEAAQQMISEEIKAGLAKQEEVEVAEVADFDKVLKTFESSSQAWPLIIDQEAKVLVVAKYIENFREQGVAINNPPESYVGLIDHMSQDSPEMLSRPFDQILQIVAVIQYDFDNGQDKDAMAVMVLGSPRAVEQNKQRLGLQ